MSSWNFDHGVGSGVGFLYDPVAREKLRAMVVVWSVKCWGDWRWDPSQRERDWGQTGGAAASGEWVGLYL